MAAVADVDTYMPWRRVVADIDAMPGVPTWKEIEQQVDAAAARTIARHQRELFPSPTPNPYRLHGWHMDNLGSNNITMIWLEALQLMFPLVVAKLASHRGASSKLVGANSRVWFMLRYMPDDVRTQFRYIRHEWTFPEDGDDATYTLERVPLPILQRLLQQLHDAIREDEAMERDDYERYARSPSDLRRDRLFEADLRVAIEERRARTNMAQSGVIDLLALHQGTPVAQHIARYLAPNAEAAARPLVIRQHASQVRQLQELRATMSAMDRPEAVLARATRQLEHLVEDVHTGSSSKKQRME